MELQKKGRRFGQLRLCILVKIGIFEQFAIQPDLQGYNPGTLDCVSSQKRSTRLKSSTVPVMEKKGRKHYAVGFQEDCTKKNGIFQEVRGWKHGGNMHAV